MKGERLAQLELILKAHPEGLRKSDIARRIGVHRSTIGRYIEDLKKYNTVSEENNLVKIEMKDSEERLELSVYESLALNMGAEMLLNNSQFQSPHLASGLRKIAMNMLSYAPEIAKNIASLADEAEKSAEKSPAQPNKVLEVLIDAWVSGRMVKIEHLNGDSKEEAEIAPYFIGFVDSEGGRNPITVTGRLRHSTEIITIDIGKIQKVEILNETYTIPDNLRAFARQDNALSVGMVVDIISITLLVKEKSALNSFKAVSHGPIETLKTKEGTYLCKFEAENSIELILRIIQCGNSVEIMEPQNFRERFIRTLKEILANYEK